MLNALLPLVPGLIKTGVQAVAKKNESKQSKQITLFLFDVALIILRALAKQSDNTVDDDLVVALEKYRKTVK